MKRTLALVLAVAAAGIAATAGSATPRSGSLHVTKECSQYDGTAGSFCTIASSNLDAIPAGSTLVATSAKGAGVLDSDLVLYTRGANAAYGHVVLDLATGTGMVAPHVGWAASSRKARRCDSYCPPTSSV